MDGTVNQRQILLDKPDCSLWQNDCLYWQEEGAGWSMYWLGWGFWQVRRAEKVEHPSEVAGDITCGYSHKLEVQVRHLKIFFTRRVVQHWGGCRMSVLGISQDSVKFTADLINGHCPREAGVSDLHGTFTGLLTNISVTMYLPRTFKQCFTKAWYPEHDTFISSCDIAQPHMSWLLFRLRPC